MSILKIKKYVYSADTSRISEDELLRDLCKFCPNIEELTTASNHNIEEELEHNIQRAKESDTLTDEDKNVLEKKYRNYA
ncbi:MAG: hypothetical protein Q9M43_12930 [Sulfurimonas sp.]|nr:hypothetical protein [Sulfurimonas sp.]